MVWGAGKGQGPWLFMIDGPGQLRQALLGSKLFSWRGWEEVPFEFCTFKGRSVVFLASRFPQVSEASLSPGPPRCKAPTWGPALGGACLQVCTDLTVTRSLLKPYPPPSHLLPDAPESSPC